MTQPVQEPTQGRVNQAEAFRQRQLFRRPNPTIVSEWLTLLREADTTINAGTTDDVEWTSMETSSTDVFQTTDAGGANPNTSGNIYVPLTAIGTYVIQARTNWESAAVDCSLNIPNDMFSYSQYSQFNPANAADGYTSRVARAMVFIGPSYVSSWTLSLTVWNDSPDNRDMTQATMQIIYYPASTGYFNPY